MELKAEIDGFKCHIEESLDNANFVVDSEGEFDIMYLEDIKDEDHLGIHHANDLNMPTAAEYNVICIWTTGLMMMKRPLISI